MGEKSTVFIILLLFLSCVLVTSPLIFWAVRAEESDFRPDGMGRVYIRVDGTVAGTDRIRRDGNIYTLTGNIDDGIIVEKSDVVIDGAGYNLTGTRWIGAGVYIENSKNVIVRNLNVKVFINGIELGYGATNCRIYGNTITYCELDGILLAHTNNNSIIGNTVTNNKEYGIRIMFPSSNNTLRDNKMYDNKYNLYVRGAVEAPESGYFLVNEIDASNLVKGKPVYYWINEHNRTVPTDGGYVALFNCTNITVQNLNISGNDQGIQLASTTNSTITQNTINLNGRHGIAVYGSNNNTISHNSITNTGDVTKGNFVASRYWEISHFEYPGIGVYGSSNNIISGNYIAKNEQGIIIWSSFENEITANIIAENKAFGIRLKGNTTDNIFYHNSFIDNKVVGGLQVSIDKRAGLGLANVWDNGTAGNYWSDYQTRYTNATEVDDSGIGNTPYVINENNQDNHPFMVPDEIPEFPSWTTLLVMMLVVSVVAVIYRFSFHNPKRERERT